MRLARSAPIAVLAVAAALAVGGCAVKPAVPFVHSTFEGFEVISYVPEQPRGIVYLFHGTGGSAQFAERVETVATLNRFIAAGYGFVSTSSTERTGDRRWDVGNASTTTNPDLARLARLHSHLVGATGLEATTPLVGIGMSNGARFVTLWGQTWKDAGYPIKAIWASMGRIAAPVSAPGALEVPTVFSAAANDFTTPVGGIVVDFGETRDAGTPAALFMSQERRLDKLRYLRIPGVDGNEAQGIFDALVDTGVWDDSGERLEPDVEAAVARILNADLPASVAPVTNEVVNETALQLAIHQFTDEYGGQVLAFFDGYVPR